MGVAGEAAFGLEPQVPFGHGLGILGGDGRAFGSWAYDGHVAFEDVQQLGQFVEADGADEAPHFGDPGIVFAGTEPGYTVFFCIHAHAAEFQYLKDFAVFGEPGLAVEDVSPISSFDGCGHNGHDGSKEYQGHQGQGDVVGPFQDQVFGRRVVALDGHHGQVEEMDFPGAVHDHVPDPGNHIGTDLMGHAVFGHQVPIVAVEAAAEHHFCLADGAGQVFEALLHRDHGLDIEMDVHAVLFHQGIHILALAQDHHSLFGRELMEIPLVGCYGPSHDEEELEHQGGQKGQERDIVPVDQEDHEIQESIAETGGQGLAVDQFIDPADGHGIAVVQVGDGIIEEAEQEHHDQVAQVVKRMVDAILVEMLPAEPKSPCDQQDIQPVEQFLLDFFNHGRIHGLVRPPVHSSFIVCRSS